MIGGRARWRLRVNGAGSVDVRLSADERELLRELPARLERTLAALDPAETPPDHLRRLFPVTHPRDDGAEEDFAARYRPVLLEHHRAALRCLEGSAGSSRLTLDELESWLAAINDLRLVLGAFLGVTEQERELDPQAPNYADWLCYHYLSSLLGEITDVLTGALPAVAAGDEVDLPEDPWGEPLGGLRWDGTPAPGPA